MDKIGIYKIENLLNGRVYIGSSNNVSRRWSDHRAKLKIDRHHNPKLQNAWNKYGSEAFNFSIIELTSESLLIEREQYWLIALRALNGYNINPIAGKTLGFFKKLHTKATKAKLRVIALARPPATPETCWKRGSWARGRKQSPSHVAKRSATHIGVKRSEAARRNMSLAQTNRFKVNPPQRDSFGRLIKLVAPKVA